MSNCFDLGCNGCEACIDPDTETQAPDPAPCADALAEEVADFLRSCDAYAEEHGTRLVPWNMDSATIRAMRRALAAYPAIPAPEGAQGDMLLVPRELIKDAAESVDDYRGSLEFGAHDRKLLGRLKAALAAPAPVATVEDNSQNWAGMDGTTAWHLIERHADNWTDIGKMMGEWLAANQAAPAPQALPATLTDEMRAVIDNEHCVYGSADELYAALLAAAPAPQAPVALPDVALCRLISSHEVYQYHPGALHEFSHAVIAEFCRMNGIPAPQTKEPTNDR